MTEERAYFWSGYVVIVVVVFIPLLMFMNKAADADSFQEKLISNDLALMSDFVLGSPGEILIDYYVNPDGSKVKIYRVGFNEKCLFVVALQGTSLESGAKTYCADNLFLNKEYLVAGVYTKIILDKKVDKLTVSGASFGDGGFVPEGGISGGGGASGGF